MGAHWIVQEGYLQIKADGHESGGHGVLHRAALVERYVVLYMNRKMEMFETSTKDPAHRVDACYLRAFCGWDGEGLLKAGESYGLELKLEKHTNTRMFVAAFNRLDLEKWCRGFVAVLDPESAAGQEVRRERRKARKEEKRALEEREEKIRQWKEQQRKMREEEILRLQMREEEIQNMTPLEWIDGLGSLDDDTARMLEKRRQRLQRRQAPTTRRVNKAAYRQRLDDAAGGKLENVQPLQAKPVQEPRIKVRVEAPAPGQYIEASGSASSRRNSNSARRRRLDSTDGSGSDSEFSRDSRMSSGPFSGGSGSFSGSIPPPPPPRSEFDDSRSDFIPPPPPSIPGSRRRDSRSQSLRGSLYDDTDRHSLSRSSISQSARYLTGVGNDKENVQASLAAILGGRKTQPRGGELRGRFDSFESTADSTANGEVAAPRTRRATGANGETPMTNAFAASLAAIRRNRADTMEDTNSVDMPSSRRRDRKRDSQLSAEGKAILQKAISMDEPSTPARKKQDTANGGRKGLFDDSSSDEDSDAGLFGIRKSNAAKSREPAAEANERLPTKGGRRGGQAPFAESEGSDDDDHHHDLGSFKRQSTPSDYTSPRSMASPASVSHVNFYSQPKNVDVIYQSGVLQNQGKKAVVVYTFAFRSGSAEQSFSRSYHEFEDIHQRLSSEALPRLPKFPSKHLLRNFTKPENMQKRAMEFVQYLQALVAIPGIFQNKRFVFEFDIHDDFVGCVLGGGSHIASSSQRTPTSTRSSKPPRGANIVSTNGAGKSRATALFGADDTDSDAESVSVPLPTPKKTKQSTTTQPAPEAEPMRKKKSKPSRKDFDDEELEPVSVTSAKRDRTRSRNSVKSVADAIPAEPTAPKIAGLPARPNLFGGGRGDLLAAIRQGAALKKTGGDGDGTVPALAAAGRGAGFPAPSSAPPPPPPPPRPAPVTNAGSVAEAISNAMASRRIHIEYEDNSDDSDDDWD